MTKVGVAKRMERLCGGSPALGEGRAKGKDDGRGGCRRKSDFDCPLRPSGAHGSSTGKPRLAQYGKVPGTCAGHWSMVEIAPQALASFRISVFAAASLVIGSCTGSRLLPCRSPFFPRTLKKPDCWVCGSLHFRTTYNLNNQQSICFGWSYILKLHSALPSPAPCCSTKAAYVLSIYPQTRETRNMKQPYFLFFSGLVLASSR